MPERAARLYELCGGRDAYYALLDRLVHADVTMTGEQVEAYAARWPGNGNFTRTPGGFTPEEGAALYRSLFVR